jgi:hypothetical protein
VLRGNFSVEVGPPWLVTASEVTGGQRSGGGYSSRPSCVDRRRRQWSSRRLQCRSRGKGRLGRPSSVTRVRGREGGSSVGNARRWQGENGAHHPGNCAGAVETGTGRAVSDAVREQGSGQCAWAMREHVGWPGKKRAGPGPREQCRLGLKMNFQT